MQKIAKNEVFGYFQEFGLLDRLDIAYCDSTKCFPSFGNVTRSLRTIQKSLKFIFEWSKEQKIEVFAHFLEFGLLDRLDIAWISLKMHIPINRMDTLVLIADEVLGTIIVHA